ncbi:metallophosphoesterase [Spirosoma rhododendri]|nr:metallophosphoesterase [Spirosoma rhododendri]
MWRDAPLNEVDHVVFTGDYVDSYVYDDDEIVSNLEAIIRYKKKHSDRVTLLIGNHDAQYIHYPLYPCSGFSYSVQPRLTRLFDENRSLFQIAYQQGPVLFTHAGVSARWLARLLSKTGQADLLFTPADDLAGFLNDVYRNKGTRNYLFSVGPARGGHAPFGGPVWADRSETSVDLLAGFHQVVGHTPVLNFETVGDVNASITYTDVLGTKTDFFRLTIPV